MNWREIVNLSDGDLINKGVAALGARRKMLKVFEQVRKEMLLQVRKLFHFCDLAVLIVLYVVVFTVCWHPFNMTLYLFLFLLSCL